VLHQVRCVPLRDGGGKIGGVIAIVEVRSGKDR
jgi:hypothetical protein